MASVDPDLKNRVHDFWDEEPCGTEHAVGGEGTPEYFRSRDSERDRLEPYVGNYAKFDETAGLKVLEIGTGMGTDFMKFVRAGAKATGVDLTEKSIELIEKRLEIENLRAELIVADAEKLPFEDNSFDVVYSWGVLHHTPNTEAAVREAIRVLRPGGRLCLMLYGRHSWLSYALWLKYAFLKGRPFESLSSVISRKMESDGTKAYTRKEVLAMLETLDGLSAETVVTDYDRRVAGPLTRLLSSRLGWFIVAAGYKPANKF